MVRFRLKWPISAIAVFTSSVPAQPPAAEEPLDLQVQLRFAAGSNRFRVGEAIPLEVILSSNTPDRYLEPCELFVERYFGFPQCRFFTR
jgi:hypothetical protein